MLVPVKESFIFIIFTFPILKWTGKSGYHLACYATSDRSLPNLLKIQQSVYSVDDISLEYTMEHKADFLEDASSCEGELHFHNLHFPLFEVVGKSLGIIRNINMEDELLDFENIEPQQRTELVLGDGKELLSSIEFDLMKYLSGHRLAVQCLEVELHCSNFALQMDYICVVEQSHCEEYSTVNIPSRQSRW
ncbi:unnamed protein product [Fraxinus pennsylvanica]|uniref:Uncharacterized protein n=1 Tax=Fraxinus pennsylvanica TaxID=56036 RepID=A0AAD2DQE5_9LAMI|nr:unnamed protein product [Fraxinus pennsylvanica]